MNRHFDLAVIGSGFSGSILAMIARRLGRSVVMIERAAHPRFAIGESSTPLASLLLEQISMRYDLPRLRPLCEWGSWQKTYPHLACGLKRGFTFYHHQFDHPWRSQPDRANELLVAASPRDEVADTHWFRADFDHFLVCEAQALGVEYLDRTELASTASAGNGLLEGRRDGRAVKIRARFVVDATGPRGFLHRALELPVARFCHLPGTEGLFTHFSGVRRWEDLTPASGAPYPVDDAAVHHVFPGGWIWVLRFNNGLSSAGVAAVTQNEFRLQEPGAWDRLLSRLPAIGRLFTNAQPVRPFIHAAPLPFRSGRAAGSNWALLPSAAGFVDPLLSTGFPLTLLGIQRLAKIIERPGSAQEHLEAYEYQTLRELDLTEKLVGALYRNMAHPANFNAIAFLYFAAASFTETAHRLGKPELAGSTFLLGDHPAFAPAFQRCLEVALHQPDPALVLKYALGAIEPVDAIGLSNLSRRNSYPVDAGDLRRAAGKFGVSLSEIDAMLARCGFIAKD